MLRARSGISWVVIATWLLSGCEASNSGGIPLAKSLPKPAATVDSLKRGVPMFDGRPGEGVGPGQGGDKFDRIVENDFLAVRDNPLSTFSIDVDTASYSKVRSYLLQNHTLPPPDAVRIEELINYFEYADAPPSDEQPFAVHLSAAACPWKTQHRLVRIGIKGRENDDVRPACNLVFLIDVSGSMNAPNRLPLVLRSLQMLTRQLGENDRVAIVVYAAATGLVLPSTPGDRQATILSALSRLSAGGSTNGGQGIQRAYDVAREHFVTGGSNRVILCTDGDFNVGTTSTGNLVRLAEHEAKSGVYLTVLGFGMGNHNDALLEQLANKANGNYSYIDSDAEARKVLVDQMGGTLVTIAKDVKIQVEFNPAHVAAYRLIGYEDRLLADRDFNDDRKDAGDIGLGHTVTALYEIVPAGAETDVATPPIDPLKYQPAREATAPAQAGDELLTVKLRYKQPAGETSRLLSVPLAMRDVTARNAEAAGASVDLRFASAVALFGMLLRKSEHCGATNFDTVLELAADARGADRKGYRAEFLELVREARRLSDPPRAARRETGSYSPRSQAPAWERTAPEAPPRDPNSTLRQSSKTEVFSEAFSTNSQDGFEAEPRVQGVPRREPGNEGTGFAVAWPRYATSRFSWPLIALGVFAGVAFSAAVATSVIVLVCFARLKPANCDAPDTVCKNWRSFEAARR